MQLGGISRLVDSEISPSRADPSRIETKIIFDKETLKKQESPRTVVPLCKADTNTI